MWKRRKRKNELFLILAGAGFYIIASIYSSFGLTPFIVIAVIFILGLALKWKLAPSSNYRETAVKVLGRNLERNEIVHHVNGNREDNGLNNLCVMDGVKHEMFHTWLRWKKEKSGSYPPIIHQKHILREEYGGILLESVQKLNKANNSEPNITEIAIKSNESPTNSITNDKLYEELRKFRNNLAREKDIPPYMIFSNETLMEMAETKPINDEMMANIKGVGSVKLRDYSTLFLQIIKKYEK
jgi:hypothetical protein